MSQSEMAFLALGLVLGAAGGAAFLVVLGSRTPRREIRVTVTRDAVPRRSPTLAIDAFVTSPAEPAPGGPGDRRVVAREELPTANEPRRVAVGPGRPAAPPGGGLASPTRPGPSIDRTIVPSLPGRASPGTTLAASAVADRTAIEREAAVADAPEPEAVRVAAAPAAGPRIRRILRGDHLAMLEVVDALAGADGPRREWEVLLTGLGAAIAETAVDEGILEFPMGTPFWDAFTVEQCRQIAASLASMGHRFDGRDGWAESRVPTYRELGQALADIGVDPRRLRVWPNSAEIAELYRGARPAADDLQARDAPDLELEAVRELARWHAESLEDLWTAWEAVRPLLLAEAVAAAATPEPYDPPGG